MSHPIDDNAPDRLAKNLFMITMFGVVAYSLAAYFLMHSGG